MKNIYEECREKYWRSLRQSARWAASFAALCLVMSLPLQTFAQEGFPGAQVESQLNRVLESGGQQQSGEDQDGAFIGTNEEGDSVMSTGRPRPNSGGVGHYEDGLIIAPQIEPIVPLRPRPPMPPDPYPGPGPHPHRQPRDGVNQLHEYNYNPEFPQEVPRRPFGGRVHP